MKFRLVMSSVPDLKGSRMLLVIDCGNTNTVFGLFDEGRKLQHWRMTTMPSQTSDDMAVWLSHHMQRAGFTLERIDGVVVSSVVPQLLPAFRQLARDHLSLEAFVITADNLDHGVAIKIPNPAQAGADRIANTAGARAYKLPAMVIDFGTATTFDLIDADGAYIGGAIAPGVNLSINALYQAAARLPLIDSSSWTQDMPVLGNNTIDAMNSGLYHGYVSLVEGMITRLKAAFGAEMTVIATGGLANIFSISIAGVDHHDPDLTLNGMVAIYTSIREKS